MASGSVVSVVLVVLRYLLCARATRVGVWERVSHRVSVLSSDVGGSFGSRLHACCNHPHTHSPAHGETDRRDHDTSRQEMDMKLKFLVLWVIHFLDFSLTDDGFFLSILEKEIAQHVILIEFSCCHEDWTIVSVF